MFCEYPQQLHQGYHCLSAQCLHTYLIAIEWDAQFLNSKDKKKGNKSLIEIDEKLYKALVKSLL